MKKVETVLLHQAGSFRSDLLAQLLHHKNFQLTGDKAAEGIAVMPAEEVFNPSRLAMPRGGSKQPGGMQHLRRLKDSDLSGKFIFYFSHRWWSQASGPDNTHNTKWRQIQEILRRLIDQDGLEEASVYIWIDFCVCDQDCWEEAVHDFAANCLAVIARASYFVVLENCEDGSATGALSR